MMKTRLLALLAVALWVQPFPAFGAEPVADPAEISEESPSASPEEPAPDDAEDGEAAEEAAEGEEAVESEQPPRDPPPADLDEDDLIEIRGLVFEFYVADDSQETQLAIEAHDRDYRVAPGHSAQALAKQLGKTVRAQGWPVPDDAGDIWLALDTFQVTD